MKVGLLPRGPLHRNPIRISRASQQRHRSPEPDCPHRSSLPGIPETASLGPDQSPQRSASSDLSANGVGIIQRESNNQMRFHTWGNSGIVPYEGAGNQLSDIDEATSWDLAIMESRNGTLCRIGRIAEANSDLHC